MFEKLPNTFKTFHDSVLFNSVQSGRNGFVLQSLGGFRNDK